MNPRNKVLTDEQVKHLRVLVWDAGLTYREAIKAMNIPRLNGNVMRAIRGLAYKSAGGPTGGEHGRKR